MNKLHIDNTSGVLLLFAFIDYIMLALAYPAIRKVTGELLPARYFAIEGILSCACGLLVCMSWNSKKFRKFSFKIFKGLAFAEIIAFASIGISMYLWFNIWVFAIGTLITQCIICVFMARILNSFRVAIFPDREREFYDNNMHIVSSVSYLLGLTVVAIWPIPLDVSILLWGFGCFGDIGWLIIYRRHKSKFNRIDQE